MSLQWNTDYAVGHSLVDAQHQELFKWFNVLIEACKEQKGRQEIVNLFNFLDRYVVEHFAAEEGLMSVHHYPEMNAHRSQHQAFIAKLKEWREQLNQSGVTLDLLVETNEALFQWLIRHIRVMDGELGRFLQSYKE